MLVILTLTECLSCLLCNYSVHFQQFNPFALCQLGLFGMYFDTPNIQATLGAQRRQKKHFLPLCITVTPADIVSESFCLTYSLISFLNIFVFSQAVLIEQKDMQLHST